MVEQQPEQVGDVKNIRRFVAFFGIFLLLLSQFLVFSKEVVTDILLPPYFLIGVFGVVILVFSQFIPSNVFWQKLSQRAIFGDRAFWVLVAVLLAIVTSSAVASYMTFRRINYIPIITFWLLSGISYVYAFVYSKNNAGSTKAIDWLKQNRNEILIVLSVMLLAAVIRFYQLGDLPRVLDGDEGSVGNFARSSIEGNLANPFALWDNFGALYLQLINLSMRFFGYNSFGLRLMPALGGILAVPAVYLFARWLGGRRVALISAFMLAASHSHIHFSRISSVAYIQDTWLIPFEMYFLISGLTKRQSWRTALSGVILAIHYCFYLTSQIITGLVLVYMLILLVFYRAWFKERISQALAFWGGFLIMIPPSFIYAYKNPNEFMGRLSSAGTFQTGWLDSTIELTGQSTFQILFGRVVHAFLSLFYYPAIDFYGSPSPMLMSTVLFFAGMGIVLWKIRNPANLLLLGYFWGTTVAIGIFALPPSADSYRMLMGLPAAVTMAAIGFDQILEIIGIGWKQFRVAYSVTALVIFTSFLAFNLWTYYAEFAGQCRFATDLPGRFGTYLGLELQQIQIQNENRVYLLSNDIYFYGSHPATFFLSPRPVINFSEPIDTLDAVSGETIIAPTDRIEELEEWARRHPGGRLNYEYDCTTNILLSYQVP